MFRAIARDVLAGRCWILMLLIYLVSGLLVSSSHQQQWRFDELQQYQTGNLQYQIPLQQTRQQLLSDSYADESFVFLDDQLIPWVSPQVDLAAESAVGHRIAYGTVEVKLTPEATVTANSSLRLEQPSDNVAGKRNIFLLLLVLAIVGGYFARKTAICKEPSDDVSNGKASANQAKAWNLAGWTVCLVVTAMAFLVRPLSGVALAAQYPKVFAALSFYHDLGPALAICLLLFFWLRVGCRECAVNHQVDALKPRFFLPISIALIALTFVFRVAWGAGDGVIVDQHAYSAPLGSALAQSDAQQYEIGAQLLVLEGKLPEWNQRRPINTAWDSVELGLAGMDTVRGMALGAVLLGLAIGVLAQTIAGCCGSYAGWCVLVLCWGMSRFFVATQLSEVAGLTGGALAAACFVRGICWASFGWYGLGVLLMSLSQSSRPGAMFVLPALVLLPTLLRQWQWSIAQSPVANWLVRTSCLGALVLVGLSVNPALNRFYGTNDNVSGSNFALTFAGLASGSSWREVEIEFEDALRKLPNEAERASFLYRVGWQRLRESPMTFAKQSLKGVAIFAYESPLSITVSLMQSRWGREPLFRMLLAVCWLAILLSVGSRMAKLSKSDRWPLVLFIVLASLGILASVPIVYLDGGIRVLVATWPLVFVFLAAPFYADDSVRDRDSAPCTALSRGWSLKYAWTICLCWIIAVLTMPAMLHRIQGSESEFNVAVEEDRSVVVGKDVSLIVSGLGPEINFEATPEGKSRWLEAQRQVQLGQLPIEKPLLDDIVNARGGRLRTVIDIERGTQWYLFSPSTASVLHVGDKISVRVRNQQPLIGEQLGAVSR